MVDTAKTPKSAASNKRTIWFAEELAVINKARPTAKTVDLVPLFSNHTICAIKTKIQRYQLSIETNLSFAFPNEQTTTIISVWASHSDLPQESSANVAWQPLPAV